MELVVDVPNLAVMIVRAVVRVVAEHVQIHVKKIVKPLVEWGVLVVAIRNVQQHLTANLVLIVHQVSVLPHVHMDVVLGVVLHVKVDVGMCVVQVLVVTTAKLIKRRFLDEICW